jgi:hypothetical protein
MNKNARKRILFGCIDSNGINSKGDESYSIPV